MAPRRAVAGGVGRGADQGSYYRALYHRHKGRRSEEGDRGGSARHFGPIWHMFSRGVLHEDLGFDHFERHDKERQTRYLLRRLRKLDVDIEVHADAA